MLSGETCLIVNDRGISVTSNSLAAFPMELPAGLRLSYRRVFSSPLGKQLPEELHRHGDLFDLVILSEKAVIAPNYWSTLNIVGSNLKQIKKEVGRWDHFFGAKDLTAVEEARLIGDYCDVSDLLDSTLPKIKGFWNRFRFLFWDYLICGRVEPKQDSTDEGVELIKNN